MLTLDEYKLLAVFLVILVYLAIDREVLGRWRDRDNQPIGNKRDKVHQKVRTWGADVEFALT